VVLSGNGLHIMPLILSVYCGADGINTLGSEKERDEEIIILD
jgi:hypothetical protein